MGANCARPPGEADVGCRCTEPPRCCRGGLLEMDAGFDDFGHANAASLARPVLAPSGAFVVGSTIGREDGIGSASAAATCGPFAAWPADQGSGVAGRDVPAAAAAAAAATCAPSPSLPKARGQMVAAFASEADTEGGGSMPSSDGGPRPRRLSAASFSEELVACIERFLGQVPLLANLLPDELRSIAALGDLVSFEAGQSIVRQGDTGHEFFLILQGKASAAVDGKVIARLKVGDYFGEVALLRNEPRPATIAVEVRAECLKIGRHAFHRLGLHPKLVFPKRAAVGGGMQRHVRVERPSNKTPEERWLMAQALQDNENLASFVNFNDKMLQDAIALMWKEQVNAGECIITLGEIGIYFYIVQEGSFRVLVDEGRKNGMKEKISRGSFVAGRKEILSKGDSFGELALLLSAPRAATVQALEDSVVWVLDPNSFKRTLRKGTAEMQRAYAGHLEKVQGLSALSAQERSLLAEVLVEKKYTMGETVFEQGEPGNEFVILLEGKVSVIVDGVENAHLVGTRSKPVPFGERTLLGEEPRPATLLVTSEAAQVITVDRFTFEMLLGPLEKLNERVKADEGLARRSSAVLAGRVSRATIRSGFVSQTKRKESGKILRKDLTSCGLLGCGGFGAVELVRHAETEACFALKIVHKGRVQAFGLQRCVMREKELLFSCDSPFVVKLYETYCGMSSVFFLLEYAPGGDLLVAYIRMALYGSDVLARFYSSTAALAFEHLHAHRIAFRDLKPENVVLSAQGWPKLTDFGFATRIFGKTYTTCGTPDYMAPEVITSVGHTVAVDWWTLGVFIFELMVGHPPFEASSTIFTYQKMQQGIESVAFPKTFRGNGAQLVKALCASTPQERLPMKKGGAQNVRRHAWYEGVDWECLAALRVTPPFAPGDLCGSFIPSLDLRPKEIPFCNNGDAWDMDFPTST
eukprot:TRINITY_DN22754_c0_g1_i1.p1 TRINITY_DN22754_c0_g1~~TRINITY_DN22754_c0_g1_i1.p1  ORF type:complete len:924 (+),score=200.25 TRINITY_DN22754_c0_g1_i1:119-2890(+)